MRKMFLLIFAAFLLSSCLRDPVCPEQSRMTLRVDCAVEASQVKSSFNLPEDRITDWNVFVYDASGALVCSQYSGDGNTLMLTRNVSYDIFAVVNMGRVAAPPKEPELGNFRYSVSGPSEIAAGGLPMCGRYTPGASFTKKEDSITITVERLAAKYSLVIDDSALLLSSLDLKSVTVRQGALDVTPFSTESKALTVGDFDSASENDLKSLNQGGRMDFYVLENCQGVLLPSNRDQWNKVPDRLPDSGKFCTYIELKGIWNASGAHSDITCRLYLGRDNCSDFNVDRNTVNTVQICLSDQGLLKSNWKVSRENIVDQRVLEFAEKEVVVYSGEDYRRIGINVSPADVSYDVAVNQSDASAAALDYHLDGNALYVKSSYEGDANPCATFFLRTWDSVVKGSIKVTVDRKEIQSVTGFEDTYFLKKGTYEWPYLKFSDGKPDFGKLKISSSNKSVLDFQIDTDDDEQPVGIKAVNYGFAYLTVQYGTFEKKVYVYVPNDCSITGIPGPYLVLNAGDYSIQTVKSFPSGYYVDKFSVSSSDTKAASVDQVLLTSSGHLVCEGVDFGPVGNGGTYRIKGLSNGKSTIKCSFAVPGASASFNTYVLGKGSGLNIGFQPSDGRAPITVKASPDVETRLGTENGHRCILHFSGDATITEIEFTSLKKNSYHPDWSLEDYCTIEIDDEEYEIGDKCTDLDILYGGVSVKMNGSDCYIYFEVTLGSNGLVFPVRMKFASDYSPGDD